jgi:hypothetical protein
MITPLIQYELEMAVRDQTQLQRRAYLWRLVEQAPTDSNAREQSTLRGLVTRLLRLRSTSSAAAGRPQGFTTAHHEDCYRTEEAAHGSPLPQIADPRGGFDRRDHLFGGTLQAEELAR